MASQRKNESRIDYLKRAAEEKRLHRQLNPNISSAYQKRRYAENRDWERLVNILNKYNLTLDQYHSMFENQDFGCAICGVEDNERTTKAKKCFRELVVDHNHDTGKVRGLLCGTCNSLIGYAKENIAILQNAQRYLEVA